MAVFFTVECNSSDVPPPQNKKQQLAIGHQLRRKHKTQNPTTGTAQFKLAAVRSVQTFLLLFFQNIPDLSQLNTQKARNQSVARLLTVVGVCSK
jgi:hypothetical protein